MTYLRIDDLQKVRNHVHFAAASLFTVGGIWSTVLNFNDYRQSNLINTLNVNSVKYVLLCTILMAFTFIPHRISRYIQVATLLLASTLCILINNEIGVVAEFPFLACAIVLMLAYGFLGDQSLIYDIKKHKLFLLITWFILAYVIKFYIYKFDIIQFTISYLNQYFYFFAFSIILILSLKLIISISNNIIIKLRETNINISNEAKLLYTEILTKNNEIDIKNKEINKITKELLMKNTLTEIGKATSNTLHSIGNVLAQVKLLGDYIETDLSKTEDIFLYVDVSLKSINDAIKLVNNERNYLKFGISNDMMLNDVKDIIEAVLYLYRIKDKYNFITSYSNNLVININACEFKEAFMNILKNAIEASEDIIKPNIYITANRIDEYIYVEITDQGTGIEICSICGKNNCLECNKFSLGNTTKINGSGNGKRQVIDFCNKYDYGFKIKSEVNNFTKITLELK